MIYYQINVIKLSSYLFRMCTLLNRIVFIWVNRSDRSRHRNCIYTARRHLAEITRSWQTLAVINLKLTENIRSPRTRVNCVCCCFHQSRLGALFLCVRFFNLNFLLIDRRFSCEKFGHNISAHSWLVSIELYVIVWCGLRRTTLIANSQDIDVVYSFLWILLIDFLGVNGFKLYAGKSLYYYADFRSYFFATRICVATPTVYQKMQPSARSLVKGGVSSPPDFQPTSRSFSKCRASAIATMSSQSSWAATKLVHIWQMDNVWRSGIESFITFCSLGPILQHLCWPT